MNFCLLYHNYENHLEIAYFLNYSLVQFVEVQIYSLFVALHKTVTEKKAAKQKKLLAINNKRDNE